MEPIEFRIKLDDFDKTLLPIDAALLESDRQMFTEAVVSYFEDVLGRFGGETKVEIKGTKVFVSWSPVDHDDTDKLVAYCLDLLNRRSYLQAEPILHTLTKKLPDDGSLRYNYGMMLSDMGRLKLAIKQLTEAVRLLPEDANAWNALGIAQHRNQQIDEAVKSLQRSLSLDPENAYTLRNLGGLLAKRAPADGIEYLRRATELLPEDQQALYGYGLALQETGQLNEADVIYQRCIETGPHSPVAEICRQARTAIAQTNLRQASPTDIRMDVVMYCLGAIKKFEEVGPEARQTIVYEIAMLGRNGLDINDPEQKYTLRSLPGQFSGLHLVSYMYAGFREIDPSLDTGADFSREYEQALQMRKMGM